MSEETHDIEIVRRPSLYHEYNEDQQEFLNKGIEFLEKDYKEGGIERLTKTLEDTFNLDPEGVICCQMLLGLIKTL